MGPRNKPTLVPVSNEMSSHDFTSKPVGILVFGDQIGQACPPPDQEFVNEKFGDSRAPMVLDKAESSVVAAFDAAAGTYDAATQVQCEIARHLVERAALEVPAAPQTILDLGCGTGNVADNALRIWPEAELTALDASPAMLSRLCKKIPNVKTVCRDAARLDGIARYDLILSSMMLHWMENPREALAHWRGFLKPNGRLLAALPVSDSLFEWRDLIRAAGLTDGLWAFPHENFAAELCLRAEFRDFPATYTDVAGFLSSLKGSGTHRSRSSHRPVPSGAMRRLLRTRHEPLTVTFRIAFLMLNEAS